MSEEIELLERAVEILDTMDSMENDPIEICCNTEALKGIIPQALAFLHLQPEGGWIKKEDATPKIGQLILLFWPSTTHPVSKKTSSPEVACMKYAESEKYGPWHCEFIWGSGRFGHSSETFATHWMPISFPGSKTTTHQATEQPSAGEFVKKCQAAYSFSFNIPDNKLLNRGTRWLKEACSIIVHQAGELQDKEEEIERLKEIKGNEDE